VTRYNVGLSGSFADKRTRDLFLEGKAKRLPPDIARRAARKLEYVDLATRLDDLKVRASVALDRARPCTPRIVARPTRMAALFSGTE
jgi:plasmid maintenance system killer protein